MTFEKPIITQVIRVQRIAWLGHRKITKKQTDKTSSEQGKKQKKNEKSVVGDK